MAVRTLCAVPGDQWENEMTHKQKRRPAAGHAMCLVAGTLIAGLGATASASAAEWKVGNIDFNMKSTLSAGTGMRVSNPKA